jgi:hypothetical protein
MSVHLVPAAAYYWAMSGDGLPHPAEALTVSQLGQQLEHVIGVLDEGGAVLVYSDDHEHRLGVLTRQQPLLDEASLAQEIDAGNLPPIRELLAMDDRGELP